MKSSIYVFVFFILSGFLFSQAKNFGVYADYQRIFTSNFPGMGVMLSDDEYSNCMCDNGFYHDNGYQLGLYSTLIIFYNLSFEGRLGFVHNNLNYLHNTNYPTEFIDRDPDTGEIINRGINEYNIQTIVSGNLNFLTLEGFLEYSLSKRFNFIVGASAYFATSNNISLKYKLNNQDGATFDDFIIGEDIIFSKDKKIIYAYDDKIKNDNNVLFAAILGINYDFYYYNLIISPEIQYRHSFTSITEKNEWMVHYINVGLSVGYK